VKSSRALKHRASSEFNVNIISNRLREARQTHVPSFTAERLAQEIRNQLDLDLDVGIIRKIETQARGAQDYEVAAFARVLGVSSDWLLGLES
jgi:uncharacterized membrane protein